MAIISPDNPTSIARESLHTIDKLLEIIVTEDIPPINLPIIKRIIHTTGDPEYGQNFVIFPGAVEAGITTIQEGRAIVTDVNMVKAGINKKLIRRFGSKVVCNVANRSVTSKTKKNGQTLAITAMDESFFNWMDPSFFLNLPEFTKKALGCINENPQPSILHYVSSNNHLD